MVVDEKMSEADDIAGGDKTTASIAEEWERLVVKEIPVKYSPTCTGKSKSDQSSVLLVSPSDNSRQIDINTTRILERLELPRQLKSKAVSPSIGMKKPLIPFQPNQAADQGVTSSQLIRPSFQRLKRKHK